jgi:hypothetical protein
LAALLMYPFELVRLGAYWNRVEPRPNAWDSRELDTHLEAAERAGKRVVLAVGAVKNFGYPEFFVPAHHLRQPLRERSLVTPETHPVLLSGAAGFIKRIVERYRDSPAVVAWQLEHEAVDPLGFEHSWRLSVQFVERELEALRAADSSRPVVMNGYLPTSLPERLVQWWRTRPQGDSLAVAARYADIVGLDYYPRHAVAGIGSRTLYLGRECRAIKHPGKRLMVSEGQAEPWETSTTPPNPENGLMYSCPPDQMIRNYNSAMGWSRPESPLYAYLFWGAEYWVLRGQTGDRSYLEAFTRVLERS